MKMTPSTTDVRDITALVQSSVAMNEPRGQQFQRHFMNWGYSTFSGMLT